MNDWWATNHNAAAFWYLSSERIGQEMVNHIVAATYKTGCCNPAVNSQTDTSATTAKPSTPSDICRPQHLGMFIFRLARAARIDTGTLISTVVYLARLQKRPSGSAPACHWSAHHVFLSVLVLTYKYLHDVTLTNEQWAECCNGSPGDYGLSAREITRMEVWALRQLGWDLRLPEAELYAELDPLLSPIRQQLCWLRVQSRLPLPAVPPAASAYTGQPCSQLLTLYPGVCQRVSDEYSHENS